MVILNWLKRPSYFNSNLKLNLLLCLIISSFVFIFLYVFQPFGIVNFKNNKLLYTAGFGLVSFILGFSFFVFLPKFLKKSFKNWTVGKNIVFFLFLVISISFGNWFYNSLVKDIGGIELQSLRKIFFNTFSLSIFPIIVFTFLKERLFRKKREKISKNIMEFKTSFEVEKIEKEIIIYGDNNKENLTFNINNLVYITSNANYASFFINSKNNLEEHIIRNTLSNLFKSLESNTDFVRCHKSYIINSKYMDSISGNARGYFLESELLSIKIPISRGFKKENLKNLIR